MEYTNRNAAYDISRFEQREARPVRDFKVVKAKKPRYRLKPASVFTGMLMAGLVIGVLGLLLYSHAQLTELTAGINTAKKELSALQSESIRLEAELESRISIRNIEEYATKQLGLAKMEKYQMEYVNLSGGDRAVLLKAPDSLTDYNKIKLSIGSVMEYILFSLNKN